MERNNTSQGQISRSSERGNVLFLILIAVALFAALSYAVTQSTRSGGGDASRETTLVNSSTITQYPASIKTAIVRMLVSNGTSVDAIIFDAPSQFTANLTTAALQAADVFHPSGGGAAYTLAPSSVMASAAPGTWFFNAANQIYNIGQNGAPGNDVIAFLPGVSLSICQRIHTQLGLSTDFANHATETGILFTATQEKDFDNAAIPVVAGPSIGDVATSDALAGQPQGCFLQGTTYVYYHALVER